MSYKLIKFLRNVVVLIILIILSNSSLAELPVLVGSLEIKDAKEVVIRGDYAYVAIGVSGLKIVDIKNPSSPVLIGDVQGLNMSDYDIAASGEYIYVVERDGGLKIVSIKNPTNPVIFGDTSTCSTRSHITIVGNYIYSVDFSVELQIFNITKPKSPVLVKYLGNIIEHFHGISVVGNYAYIVGTELRNLNLKGDELKIIDITNPKNPILSGEIYLGDNTMGSEVAVMGNYAYTVSEYEGLKIINIADPANPILIGSLPLESHGNKIKVNENYAYVVTGSGLQIISILDPTHPVLVESVKLDDISGIEIARNYAYIVCENKLNIFKLADLRSIEISSDSLGTEKK